MNLSLLRVCVCVCVWRLSLKLVLSGFDRAFRNLGAAPCQGPDAEGAWPLLLCNVVHYVLVNS